MLDDFSTRLAISRFGAELELNPIIRLFAQQFSADLLPALTAGQIIVISLLSYIIAHRYSQVFDDWSRIVGLLSLARLMMTLTNFLVVTI